MTPSHNQCSSTAPQNGRLWRFGQLVLVTMCILNAALVLYVLSYGPAVWLSHSNPCSNGGWDGIPSWVSQVYAPARIIVPQPFSRTYGSYLNFWASLGD